MAIAFSTFGEKNEGVATNTSTVTTTPSGSNGLVVAAVLVSGGAGANSCTGVTFGGNAMTQIGSAQATDSGGNDRRLSLWYYLAGTFSGSATDTVASFSSSTNNFPEVRVASYTGVAQSGQPDSSNQYTNTATSSNSVATTTTTIADNCWVISAERDAAIGTPSSVTGGTNRGSLGATQFADTNGVVTPAGSKTITWNFSGATAIAGKIASFSPAGAAGTTIQASTLPFMGAG